MPPWLPPFPPPPSKAKSLGVRPQPQPHPVPLAAAGFLGSPGSQGWVPSTALIQHGVRVLGTLCGIPGGSALTQPGKPHEILTPPQGMTGTMPGGATQCPQRVRLGPVQEDT